MFFSKYVDQFILYQFRCGYLKNILIFVINYCEWNHNAYYIFVYIPIYMFHVFILFNLYIRFFKPNILKNWNCIAWNYVSLKQWSTKNMPLWVGERALLKDLLFISILFSLTIECNGFFHLFFFTFISQIRYTNKAKDEKLSS